MADSKVFRLLDNVTAEMVNDGVISFLRNNKNMVVGNAKTTGEYLIQAKEDADNWKRIAGITSAIKIQILVAGDLITVNIGEGKWSDKIGAGVAGAFIFAPLAVTAAIGAFRQKNLPNEIFNFIENFIMSGGKSAVLGMGAVKTISDDQVECPNCHTVNPKNTKFCRECGSKLGVECPNCHVSVEYGIKFCPECGTSMIGTKTCYKCGAELAEGQKFCKECGAKIN